MPRHRHILGIPALVAVAATALIGLPATHAAASPQGPIATSTSGYGPFISDAAVIGRARLWIDARPVVPYYQTHHYASTSDYYGDGHGHDPSGGWREDCSGFVSYAWGLSGPGYVTQTMPNITTPISWSALKPGDALLLASEHVALFVKWDDQSHTHYTLWEEANSQDDTKVESGVSIDDSYWSQFTPVRYNHIRHPAATGDYNGDGKLDPAVWRPSSGAWYFHGARANFTYGVQGDIPVPGDYNGDGKLDPAVWRPSTGRWYFHGVRSDTTYGEPGDIPVPADYNGDGTTDIALWRPSTGVWYLDGVAANATYGVRGDIPVPADYNGDGKADLALWRPSTGVWYFHGARTSFSYGVRGDIPVPADYTNDGIADPAVWRPSTGVWYFHGALGSFSYGVRGDVPQPGNLDADRASEAAVWRPSTGTWYFNGLRTAFSYGVNGDIPVSSLVLNGVVLHQLGLV